MSDNGHGLGELAAALAKAQAAFPKVLKDRTAKIESAKGAYAYKYADLASLLEAVRKPLADNGLALAQPIEITESGMVLHTVLLHVSGQHLDSYYPLAAHDRPQEMGSEITYSRRYTAGSILGIASEDDDDGAAAQQQPRARWARPGRPVDEIGRPEGREPVPTEQIDAEAAQAFPPDDDREFLLGGVIRAATALKLTAAEKKDLAKAYLGGLPAHECQDVEALKKLYLFLGDKDAVAQWRKERVA
jgi:hypothetical protein